MADTDKTKTLKRDEVTGKWTDHQGKRWDTATRIDALSDAMKLLRDTSRIVIPLPSGDVLEFGIPSPLTESEWDYFTAVLTAMKPGIVREPKE
jgi:hypothetical protein